MRKKPSETDTQDVGNAADEVNQWIDGLGILQKNEEEEPMAKQINITAGNTVFMATVANITKAVKYAVVDARAL